MHAHRRKDRIQKHSFICKKPHFGTKGRCLCQYCNEGRLATFWPNIKALPPSIHEEELLSEGMGV
eukprot:3194895-Amphidinium_carterae.1